MNTEVDPAPPSLHEMLNECNGPPPCCAGTPLQHPSQPEASPTGPIQFSLAFWKNLAFDDLQINPLLALD